LTLMPLKGEESCEAGNDLPPLQGLQGVGVRWLRIFNLDGSDHLRESFPEGLVGLSLIA
jgi:hypothetical protein